MFNPIPEAPAGLPPSFEEAMGDAYQVLPSENAPPSYGALADQAPASIRAQRVVESVLGRISEQIKTKIRSIKHRIDSMSFCSKVFFIGLLAAIIALGVFKVYVPLVMILLTVPLYFLIKMLRHLCR